MRRFHPTLYALGNLGTNIYLQSFATFVLFFYVDHLGASVGLISLVMGIQGVWHAVVNPLVGQISDRTRSRFGRRVPYLAGATLPLGVAYALIWRPWVSRAHLPLYFLVVVTAFDLFYIVAVLNWTSLFPEMARTLPDRARVQSTRQAVGIVALMIGVSAPPLIYGRFGWGAMGIVFAIIGTVGFVAVLAGVREEPAPVSGPRPPLAVLAALKATAANRGFWSYIVLNFFVQYLFSLLPATLPFFAKYVLHVRGLDLTLLLASIFVVALLAVYPWSLLIRRSGSHRAMALTLLLLAGGVLPFFWATTMAWALAAGVVLGVGLAGFLSLADVLIAEVIDADAARVGQRREGSFYGVNGFFIRFGVTLEAATIYLVFHLTGYRPNAAGYATPLVIVGLRILMAGVPLLALAIAGIALRLFDVPESPRDLPDDAVPVHPQV